MTATYVYDWKERVFVLSRVTELDTGGTWCAVHQEVGLQAGWARREVLGRGREGSGVYYITCNTRFMKEKILLDVFSFLVGVIS